MSTSIAMTVGSWSMRCDDTIDAQCPFHSTDTCIHAACPCTNNQHFCVCCDFVRSLFSVLLTCLQVSLQYAFVIIIIVVVRLRDCDDLWHHWSDRPTGHLFLCIVQTWNQNGRGVFPLRARVAPFFLALASFVLGFRRVEIEMGFFEWGRERNLSCHPAIIGG